MNNVISVILCPACKRNMQADVIEYHQTDLIFGQVIKYNCITYLCTGCGEKIDTMNTFNANQTSARIEYQKKLKELLNEN